MQARYQPETFWQTKSRTWPDLQLCRSQPKTFHNRKIFRELNNVTLAELPSKLIRVVCIIAAQLSAGSDQIAVHLIGRRLILSTDHSSHAPTIFLHESVDPTLSPSNENFAEQWSTFSDVLSVKIQPSHCLECQILRERCCQWWN